VAVIRANVGWIRSDAADSLTPVRIGGSTTAERQNGNPVVGSVVAG
jgi:hypothetical protein